MEQGFKTQMMKKLYAIESNHLLSIVRRGLTMLVPAIVVGAVAYAILYFPNEAFRYLITERYAGIGEFLNAIYQGTFGMFSMILVVTLSISYAMEKNEDIDKILFYVVTAVASFGTQILMVNEGERIEMLGNRGCFVAMFVGLLSCFLFSKIKKLERISLSKYTLGTEIIPANAIQSIIPVAITVGCFALVEYVFHIAMDGKSVYMLWTDGACQMFDNVGDGFLSALLYTVLVHVLWVFGFHGSHMMETAVTRCFSAVGEDIIFSKSFFDTFVVMGGCGTSICVLIGIFLFAKKERMRNMGKIALPTVIFNTNEILNFGLPIMLNPVLAIPFVCVPILALVLSYSAIALGLVPHVTHEITWTMPILFSGYMATGSIAGSILQLVIIVLGVAIYAPFLKIYEKIYNYKMQEKVNNLVKELQEYEEQGEHPDFVHRLDDSGMVTRMLLQELKTAIREKDLYLMYQPQVDGTGRYIGAEALLRWQHSEYGFIYPPLIIYLAKEGNMLPELEHMLFDVAIESIKKISESCKNKFKISVNITAHSLDWNIEDYIKEKLEKYQVPAEKLWLEITEQDVLINSEAIENKINQLKAAGHTLLIDDFGMGHTSLSYLQSEYFGVVKLDGSLVRHLLDRETNQKIVASVIELGRKLNIKVIAEFVETQEQRDMLKEMGCDWYQGYLYGKPVVLEQFIEDMQKNTAEFS